MGDKNRGPYVRNAVLCQEVVTNSDGQINGVVGMADNINVSADQLAPQMPDFRVETKAVIQLVAGSAQGKRVTLKFETEDPAGTRQSTGDMSIQFHDYEWSVASVVIDYQLDVTREGAHWLDVYAVPDVHARARLLTRIPFTVTYTGWLGGTDMAATART